MLASSESVSDCHSNECDVKLPPAPWHVPVLLLLFHLVLTMGKVDSPYHATQQLAWALEVVYGDRRDRTNPLCLDWVELNLPGSAGFDPSRLWVAKRLTDLILAADVHFYVDDGKVTASSPYEAWQTMRRVVGA